LTSSGRSFNFIKVGRLVVPRHTAQTPDFRS
jgi:hypothetical protein